MVNILIAVLLLIPTSFLVVKTIEAVAELVAIDIVNEIERRMDINERIRENKKKLEEAKKNL